jgi:glutamate formiminotransferase
MAILECVANVSEGRDPAVIDAIAGEVRAVLGARLADVHSDPDHHRSVFTFLGAPEAVEPAALGLARAALTRIDMRNHQGAHPRLGALDVLPFVPLRGMTMASAVSVMYLARSGAVVVGARGPLVAFNVWLDGNDLDLARAIARTIRESGGGLPGVQAMGVRLPSHGLVQVSMNLLDYRRTSLKDAFEAVKREAEARGVKVARSELVGLLPREALGGAEPAAIGLDLRPEQILDTHLEAGDAESPR